MLLSVAVFLSLAKCCGVLQNISECFRVFSSVSER